MKQRLAVCPTEDCGHAPFKGVVWYNKKRIPLWACPECGGYWHRIARVEFAMQFSYCSDGTPDWNMASEDVRTGYAYRTKERP